ncbi:hypothetical protein QAD02_000785 [Eretmocerus hayati]|uniref:Uncharacterized protein n=1 Tax=Eretmocerus hayati TaxID=131215 RepID=A0ACC2NF67_9HYME|nr:hypothetical protein QAD02_000785 [Eretmocerus hayati]
MVPIEEPVPLEDDIGNLTLTDSRSLAYDPETVETHVIEYVPRKTKPSSRLLGEHSEATDTEPVEYIPQGTNRDSRVTTSHSLGKDLECSSSESISNTSDTGVRAREPLHRDPKHSTFKLVDYSSTDSSSASQARPHSRLSIADSTHSQGSGSLFRFDRAASNYRNRVELVAAVNVQQLPAPDERIAPLALSSESSEEAYAPSGVSAAAPELCSKRVHSSDSHSSPDTSRVTPREKKLFKESKASSDENSRPEPPVTKRSIKLIDARPLTTTSSASRRTAAVVPETSSEPALKIAPGKIRNPHLSQEIAVKPASRCKIVSQINKAREVLRARTNKIENTVPSSCRECKRLRAVCGSCRTTPKK